MDTKNRWIIVSNRLPLEVKNDEIIRGSGGLITAITGIDSTNPILWAGLVPGEDIEGEYLTSLKKLKDKIQYHPIFIKKKEYHKYYNGFCNDVLWPLLHYETEYVRYDLSNWNTYVEVNKKIAKNLSTLVQTNDIVWIHDFHLLLVPKFLKKIKPNCKVGFFLHIPFPSYEIFRQLPMANYILEGVLWSDLIGFHDYSYLRHFVSSVRGVLGIYPTKMQVEFRQHQTKLGVFPASINYQIFREISKSKETELLMDKWKQSSFEIEKVILGVDRLDYTKGIDLKLKAYEVFLEKYPQWQGRIQLLQLATPTRTEVPEYIKLKNEIDMTIGRINGKFGTANYVPIKYIFNSVTPEELAALYSHADVLLVTSKRDGMNLVALEYIVSQNNVDPGVVILSEFTGAVSHLSEAISINPWNIYETADAIFHAINIPLPEKIRKNEIMKKFLFNYTATTWAQRFIRELEAHRVIDQKTRYINSEENIPTEIQAAIKKHRSNLLLLLDYDGTLTPIRSDPAKALLTLRARRLIHKFAITDNVDVCIISGRDRDFLKSQFENYNVYLAAEHGAQFYNKSKDKWMTLVTDHKKKWYSSALKVMNDFANMVPSSFVERKDYAICWHYRNSPAEFAEYQAVKLRNELEELMRHYPVNVISGKKVVEIKDHAANKGVFLRWFLNRYDFSNKAIIAIGDDATDESLFKELNSNKGITIKVGTETSSANFRMIEHTDVLWFLEKIFKIL